MTLIIAPGIIAQAHVFIFRDFHARIAKVGGFCFATTWDEKAILRKLNPPSVLSSLLGWDRCHFEKIAFSTFSPFFPNLALFGCSSAFFWRVFHAFGGQ